MASTLLQDAVLRNLQILAESTKRINASTKDACPDIDWYRIAGFRNVLVHDYLGLDLDQVWIVVAVEMPKLKAQMLRLRNELG